MLVECENTTQLLITRFRRLHSPVCYFRAWAHLEQASTLDMLFFCLPMTPYQTFAYTCSRAPGMQVVQLQTRGANADT